MSLSFLGLKSWHPGNKANQRRRWEAEQRHEEEKKRERHRMEELKREQDVFTTHFNTGGEHAKGKAQLSFMYQAPKTTRTRGDHERDKDDEDNEEHKDKDRDNSTEAGTEERTLYRVLDVVNPLDYGTCRTQWEEEENRKQEEKEEKESEKKKKKKKKKKSNAEHSPIDNDDSTINTAAPTHAAAAASTGAAQERIDPSTGSTVTVRQRPFGVPLRSVRCARCGNTGHRAGDRECPLKDSHPQDADRRSREDPLTAIATAEAQLRQERLRLKDTMHDPNGGDPDDPNQRFVTEEDDPETMIDGLSRREQRRLRKLYRKLKRQRKELKRQEKGSLPRDNGHDSSDGSEDDSKREKRKHKKKRREKKKRHHHRDHHRHIDKNLNHDERRTHNDHHHHHNNNNNNNTEHHSSDERRHRHHHHRSDRKRIIPDRVDQIDDSYRSTKRRRKYE